MAVRISEIGKDLNPKVLELANCFFVTAVCSYPLKFTDPIPLNLTVNRYRGEQYPIRSRCVHAHTSFPVELILGQ
jgi:hypothetical protein